MKKIRIYKCADNVMIKNIKLRITEYYFGNYNGNN